MSEFEITDHCFVPPSYSESDDPFTYKDACAFHECGSPESRHLWTVDEYRSNFDALSDLIWKRNAQRMGE